MKKAIVTVLAILVAASVAALAGRAEAAPAKAQDVSIVGTGATFPFPLISKWIPELGKALGISLTYSPTGSGAGIAGVTARTVDFGASDAPLSPDQLAACKGCVVIPWALSATSIPYNIPGLTGRLKLDGPTLANIYLGKITNWNDPAITSLNGGVTLPDLKITPVYRSDGSGTTYNFTEYLASVSREWKEGVGFSTAVSWKAGVGARGSSGVAGVVKSTPGALTYVDVAYSLQNTFTFAQVKNRAGKFATPGLRGIQAALSKVPDKVTELSQLKIVDPPAAAGPLAYPIVTFTYVIVPTDAKKAADLRKMVYWAVTQGQKFGPPLLFQPLPKPVQAFAYREIKKIGTAAGA
ncbi:MAG: phosphate ABC transporter substrate-binding protein PstS [Actinobacteria bacterium]|nr:phosphate ABC transporter substrate-binding protein PstS [Actinomycetota bacterium]